MIWPNPGHGYCLPLPAMRGGSAKKVTTGWFRGRAKMRASIANSEECGPQPNQQVIEIQTMIFPAEVQWHYRPMCCSQKCGLHILIGKA